MRWQGHHEFQQCCVPSANGHRVITHATRHKIMKVSSGSWNVMQQIDVHVWRVLFMEMLGWLADNSVGKSRNCVQVAGGSLWHTRSQPIRLVTPLMTL